MECLYQNEANGMQCPKCNPSFGATSPLRRTGLQRTLFHAAPYRADSTNLRVCRAKNVILVSVQKAHFAVQTCNEPCFMQPRIGPTVQICVNSVLPIAMVTCLNQWNVYIKRKLRVCTAKKNAIFVSLQKTPPRSTGLQRTQFHAAPYRADSTNLREFGATYRHCTVFAPKECLYQKEAKGKQPPIIVILVSVQKAHFAVRTYKEPCFMQRRIGSTVQNCENSGIAIAMVPCLHQWNVYIKRKLKASSAQKCKPCFGAKSPLRTTDLQRTLFHAAPYMADSTKLREFGDSYHHGTVFAPDKCLYQKEAEDMQYPKCKPYFGAKSPLRRTDLQRTLFHAAPQRADSPNLSEFGAGYRHVTVFTPTECLYQKEAQGMQFL